MTTTMEQYPELNTDRLKLRKLVPEDIPSLVRYADNRKISDNIINIPYPYREPDAVFRISYVVQGFRKKTLYVFAIAWKESGEFIGEASLHVEDGGQAQLGYWVGEPFWNKGIATEAVGAILKFGFEQLNLSRIYATAHIRNTASVKVLLKNGMKKENVNGNVALYVVTKKEYEKE